MGYPLLIIGESGAGKSASIETLNPKETFLINVVNKPLPYKGWRKYYKFWTKESPDGNMYHTASAEKIRSCMTMVSEKMPHVKIIIIDDFQYVSSLELFDRLGEKNFDKWTDLAANVAKVVTTMRNLRDDLIVVVTNHAEESEDLDGRKKIKAKTMGKLIDKNLSLEGLFTTVLFAKAKKGPEGMRYVFETQNNGENTAKSPKKLFSEFEIPNDLELVKKAIEAYEV